jgi:hypothetical protein
MAQGNRPVVIPLGFQHRMQRVRREPFTLLDPAGAVSSGCLTNPSDGEIIESLRQCAVKSKAFSCWNACARAYFSSLQVFCRFSDCGYTAWRDTRVVRPGKNCIILMRLGNGEGGGGGGQHQRPAEL